MEFLDPNRPKICFLDDNFFACENWREIIAEVKAAGKRFQFKQGLDERLLDDEKIHEMMTWKYEKDWIFAFDNIDDWQIIESKLKRIAELYPESKRRSKFYILCGFDRSGKYDNEFWLSDIENVFKRCFLLAKHSALPYIMQYEKVDESEYRGLYIVMASWCNQPNIFKKFDFATFAMCKGMPKAAYKKYKRDIDEYLSDGGKKGVEWRRLEEFQKRHREIAEEWFHIVPDSLREGKARR